ncbi:MAG TPA: TIGR03960 family B12-binding radical SAM protein [Anaerohalosphaeraceae bacterium]|nr:TIGR03960 family B12-binding radical SAM protein [Anaerohalosphaeraceae bacterium]
MNRKNPEILKSRVDAEFLPFVRKPGRYIGGEINQTRKNPADCDVRVALAFPDVYEIGMSHTGLAIVYDLLNRDPGLACERVFAPWLDAEELMRKISLPLFTLESKAAVRDFDMLGFSLTNELCYTAFLNMIDLAGLPVRASQRTEAHPLIVVGGQIANCAEPLADFADLFFLGQAEEVLPEVIALYRQHKQQGHSKADFLLAAARQFDCLYVPSLYAVDYDGEELKSIRPKAAGVPARLENAVVEDFENASVPARPVVPFVEAVHDRISIEIMRGCPGRCRFCQASFCRRPIRYRSPDRILDIAKQQYAATGYDTISLLSLSTADYPHLEELIDKLTTYFAPRHVGLSVPSLRVQEQLQLLPKMVTAVRKSGLTIAVEAASPALRKMINKPISDEDLFAAVRAAYQAGFQKVKLYFMAGFPGETEADLAAVVDLSYRIAMLSREVRGRLASVNAAVSWLVPKPHTPFGWLGQASAEYFHRAKQVMIDRKRQLNARCVSLKFHHIECSVLESALARGDRRLGTVIESAWRAGAKFDLWDECFDITVWQKAFADNGMDLDACAQRAYTPGKVLPWSHLGGPKEDYLAEHYHEAMTNR